MHGVYELVAYASDEARSGAWRRLGNVQVRLGSRDGDNPEVLYRAKPLSTPTPLPTKLSPTATLDAVSVLLNNPRATTSQSHSIDSSGDAPCLEFAQSAYFPGERSLKPLDVASMLEKASDHGKSSTRRPVPPSVPCRLPPTRADPRLYSCLWRGSADPSLPHQVREPEQRLAAAETQSRQGLAHRLSTVGLVSLLRDRLHDLASTFQDCPPEELQ